MLLGVGLVMAISITLSVRVEAKENIRMVLYCGQKCKDWFQAKDLQDARNGMERYGGRICRWIITYAIGARGIVKLGDPAIKFAEIADKLEVDIIIMETKGTEASVGQVTGKVLRLTSRPTVLIT